MFGSQAKWPCNNLCLLHALVVIWLTHCGLPVFLQVQIGDNPFTCFSIFTTWHSLPLATISDWGEVSWCNWQSLLTRKGRSSFLSLCHCGAEGQGHAQPALVHSYPAGHTFPEDKPYSSSSATSAFPSEAFPKKVLCHLLQLPQPLWLFRFLVSLSSSATFHSQWTPTWLLSRLYQLWCI